MFSIQLWQHNYIKVNPQLLGRIMGYNGTELSSDHYRGSYKEQHTQVLRLLKESIVLRSPTVVYFHKVN